MKQGLYEMLLNADFEKLIREGKISQTRKVDDSELAKVISIDFEKAIRNAISNANNKEEKMAIINGLRDIINKDQLVLEDKKYIELLAVHEDEEGLEKLKSSRPRTSLASSTLFTGVTGPSLDSELRKEIRTADKIDLLVSFIKFSGLRLIYDDLVEFTQTKKLRVITTSYMGASDYKAILELAKLPNTEVKVSYDKKRTRLHAKSYHFMRETGFSTAYIGSSNISNPALSSGLEWNIKLSEYTSKDVLNTINIAFESYWNDEEFKTFYPNDDYSITQLKEALNPIEEVAGPLMFFNLQPYSHQKEILEDLLIEREECNSYRNLIVAATGTGKTMIAAFDYKEQLIKGEHKLLFLAHRREILDQSLYTFRNVLRDQNFGELWAGDRIPSEKTHIFASIQTLNSNSNYLEFQSDYFDYIVIDESHHASASTYLKILEYYNPKILLGLTATPERMDGQNILEYFNNRIATEIRLGDAINRKLLSPFHYFGVTDSVDLSHLTWSRGGYDISELENVYTANGQRVQLIIDSLNRYLRDTKDFKALGFCVSIAHADFMAGAFNRANIPAIALHSNTSEEIRNKAKHKLNRGEIKCIFTVDLFNEGVDIPEIDTVLFLRPTQSLTIFIQQLGRGLRLSENKEILTVLDFVGQAHANYDFSFKLRALMGKSSRNITEEINDDFPNIPAGCSIKLEKIAKEYILQNIKSSIFRVNDLRNMIINYENNFNSDLNLRNFLDNYGIDKNKFYSKYSFYKLLAETNMIDNYRVSDSNTLKQALRRFSRIDSKKLLKFARDLFIGKLDINSLDSNQGLMLGMLHYTLWGVKPSISYADSFKDLMDRNPDIVKELLDIVEYNLYHMRIKEIEYEDFTIPLDIYASYTIQQIMVAFGKTTDVYEYPMREGTIYVQDKHTDLFFVTINKNEEDYLPTTMYNDYAINSQLFNWESQSTTSQESPTGQRYIKDRTNEHKVLIFVRENKNEFGHASPYIFLGNAKYVSHKGDRPIEIVWKLDHSIPERIIRESSLRIVN